MSQPITAPTVVLDRSSDLAIGENMSVLPVLKLVPQLEPFKVAAAELEAQLERAVIDSVDAWQRGSDYVSICDQNWKQLEDLRNSVKRPINDYAAFVQTIFVPLQDRYKRVKIAMTGRMFEFKKAEDARAKAAEEAQRKRNEDAAVKLAEEAEKSGDSAGAAALLEVATMAPLPAPAPRLGTRNSFGKAMVPTKRWVGTVDNPMETLKAIIDGKVSISILEWRQSELNKFAANLKVEKTVFGIKLFQSETLGQR